MAWRMKGQYLKNCSCVPGCPCDTHGYPGPNEFCEGVVAMNVAEGEFEGTDLGGTRWAVLVHWPKALHDGNGTAEVFVDDGASDEQRQALGQILSGEAGGPLFEILAAIVTTVHGPHFAPIDWEFDKEARTARLAVDGFFETSSEPLTIPATDDLQRISVQIPGGFEYKEAEVAMATTLKSTAEIKYDWQNTHSSLADVEHTNEALVA
jgi:hypothetical protein